MYSYDRESTALLLAVCCWRVYWNGTNRICAFLFLFIISLQRDIINMTNKNNSGRRSNIHNTLKNAESWQGFFGVFNSWYLVKMFFIGYFHLISWLRPWKTSNQTIYSASLFTDNIVGPACSGNCTENTILELLKIIVILGTRHKKLFLQIFCTDLSIDASEKCQHRKACLFYRCAMSIHMPIG